MSLFVTNTVPTVEYENMLTEISKIKLSKRKSWKSWSKNATGQKTNIYYTPEPLILNGAVKTYFYDKTSNTHLRKRTDWEQASFKIGDIDVTPVISLEQDSILKSVVDEDISAQEADNDDDMIDKLYELWAENATGNHYRNHPIGVRTAPGQPVRG